MHEATERLEFFSPKDEMDVIGHEAVVVDFKGIFFKMTFKNFEEFFKIFTAVKKPGFIIASCDDVIKTYA